MDEYEQLKRALLVERFRPTWRPHGSDAETPEQLAQPLAPERQPRTAPRSSEPCAESRGRKAAAS